MLKKLNLGCGNCILNPQEWENHDLIKHRKEIVLTFDLNKKFPLNDNLYDEVRCDDVLEHLDNPLKTINKIHRILKLNGILQAKCCGWQNSNYWVDITHKKAFDIKSMDYLDPTTELGRIYGYYTQKKWRILDKHYDRHKNPIFKMEKI